MVVLMRHGMLIQNDPRKFMKSLERQILFDRWKNTNKKSNKDNTSPKQVRWFLLYSKQIMKRAKSVWEQAIKAGDGKMWIYFIFAVCQWLPTNHRLFYGDESPHH